MNKATGGCLCGSIRYEVTATTNDIIICHCTSCQKASGAGASTNIALLAKDLVFTAGQPKIYVDTAASGTKLNRAFCADCGSSIYSMRQNMMDRLVLKAGSLDDSDHARVMMHIWTQSRRPWSYLDESITAHQGNPPGLSQLFTLAQADSALPPCATASPSVVPSNTRRNDEHSHHWHWHRWAEFCSLAA